MDSAPTAGPEERSCCRSVLLMNYDTKRFEEVPGERNSPDQVHLSLWNHRRRNGQFTPFIFYSLVCHAVKEGSVDCKIQSTKQTLSFCGLTGHVDGVPLARICGGSSIMFYEF